MLYKSKLTNWLLLSITLILLTPLYTNAAIDKPSVLSQMNGLRIRLVPRNPDAEEGLGPKIIHVRQNDRKIQIKWYSQIRKLVSSDPWPEYKVMMKKGVLQTEAFHVATSMVHPHIWRPGFFNLDQNGLLWAPPAFLSGSKGYKPFEPGFLSPSFNYFTQGPKQIISKIEAFRVLVESFLSKGIPEDQKWSRKRRKQIRTFLENFPNVKVLSSNRSVPLIINGNKEKVPVTLIGNKYVEYTVLKHPTNPLVLRISFKPSATPHPFKPFVHYFHKHMEYVITQIQTSSPQTNNP